MPDKIPSGQCTANIVADKGSVNVKVAGFSLPGDARRLLEPFFGSSVVVDPDGHEFSFTLERPADWQQEVRAQVDTLVKVFAIMGGASDLKPFYHVDHSYEGDPIRFV